MSHVMLAGFPASLLASLQKRLPGVFMCITQSGVETLQTLAQGDSTLLCIDHELSDPSAEEVLCQLRSDVGLAHIPVVYCLGKHPTGALGQRLVHTLGVKQLLCHPVDSEELASQIAAILGITLAASRTAQQPGRAQVMAEMAELRGQARSILLARVDVLEEAARAVSESRLVPELLQQATREAHKLVGSAGTFGFDEGTRLARDIEHILQTDNLRGEAASLQLTALIAALRQELAPEATELSASQSPLENLAPWLLIVDNDHQLDQQLLLESAQRGFSGEIVGTLKAAQQALVHRRPDVVLLDLGFAEDTEDCWTLLAELATSSPPIPALILTAQNGVADRVEAARLGGRGFLHKLTAPTQIVDMVQELLEHSAASGIKVLAVDDDPQILQALRAWLEPRNMRLTTLNDPLCFWDVLEKTSPELLVLDLDMPHISGIELCRAVRHDPRWRELPILFLTVHTDATTIQRVFATGADDYMSKPLIGPEVVTRIANRMERTRLLQRMAETDLLTGLANRHKALRELERYLHLAKRYTQPFSLAVVDLDHFKQVNDHYGHAMGDEALRYVGLLLQQSFRSEDMVARWGGEEFMVGMYGMTRENGVHRLAEVLEELRQKDLQVPGGGGLQVTFSAGVAEYPADGLDLQTLYRAADEALYQAKSAGRNRVLPVGWPSQETQLSSAVDLVLVTQETAWVSPLLVAMETRGYHTCWLQDGPMALEALRGPQPQLRSRVIVLDTDLTGLEDIGIQNRLAQDGIGQDSHVVCVASQAPMIETPQAVESESLHHLTKPLGMPALMQYIRRLLAKPPVANMQSLKVP